MSSPLSIWYRLVDSSGKQVKDTTADNRLVASSGKKFRATKVLINPPADVDDFLEAVKAKSHRLSSVDVDKLFVYKTNKPLIKRKSR
jgi:hypothetical protein